MQASAYCRHQHSAESSIMQESASAGPIIRQASAYCRLADLLGNMKTDFEPGTKKLMHKMSSEPSHTVFLPENEYLTVQYCQSILYVVFSNILA